MRWPFITKYNFRSIKKGKHYFVTASLFPFMHGACVCMLPHCMCDNMKYVIVVVVVSLFFYSIYFLFLRSFIACVTVCAFAYLTQRLSNGILVLLSKFSCFDIFWTEYHYINCWQSEMTTTLKWNICDWYGWARALRCATDVFGFRRLFDLMLLILILMYWCLFGNCCKTELSGEKLSFCRVLPVRISTKKKEVKTKRKKNKELYAQHSHRKPVSQEGATREKNIWKMCSRGGWTRDLKFPQKVESALALIFAVNI